MYEFTVQKVVLPHQNELIKSNSQKIPLLVPWRVSAADQTFSSHLSKQKIFQCFSISAQKQYVDFRSVILDPFRTGFALARLGQRARRWGRYRYYPAGPHNGPTMTNHRKALASVIAQNRLLMGDTTQNDGGTGLCRLHADVEAVEAWSSHRPLLLCSSKLELADLRECRADVAELRQELDEMLYARQAKQVKYEGLQAVLRQVALERSEPSVTEEKHYLLQQMRTIDEASKAEAKYQASLGSMARRARASHRSAQEELRALKRVLQKCDREMGRARKYERCMFNEKEAVVRELAQLQLSTGRLAVVRREQIAQLHRLRNTDDELLRRAVAREARKISISRTVAGDLEAEDEQELQRQSAAKSLRDRVWKDAQAARTRANEWEASLQLLCEVSGSNGVGQIVDRFHMQRQMKQELEAKLELTLQREALAKENKSALTQVQYDSAVVPKSSQLSQDIDRVQGQAAKAADDLEARRVKYVAMKFVILSAGDAMWRCIGRVGKAIRALHISSATEGSSAAATTAADTMMAKFSQCASDHHTRRDPVVLLKSFATQLDTLYDFFLVTVPANLHSATPTVDPALLSPFNSRIGKLEQHEGFTGTLGAPSFQWRFVAESWDGQPE